MRWGPIHLNEDDGEEGNGRVQKLLNYFNYERLSDRSKAMARSGIICFLIVVSILFISLGSWKLFGHAGGHHHHPCHDSPSHKPSGRHRQSLLFGQTAALARVKRIEEALTDLSSLFQRSPTSTRRTSGTLVRSESRSVTAPISPLPSMIMAAWRALGLWTSSSRVLTAQSRGSKQGLNIPTGATRTSTRACGYTTRCC